MPTAKIRPSGTTLRWLLEDPQVASTSLLRHSTWAPPPPCGPPRGFPVLGTPGSRVWTCEWLCPRRVVPTAAAVWTRLCPARSCSVWTTPYPSIRQSLGAGGCWGHSCTCFVEPRVSSGLCQGWGCQVPGPVPSPGGTAGRSPQGTRARLLPAGQRSIPPRAWAWVVVSGHLPGLTRWHLFTCPWAPPVSSLEKESLYEVTRYSTGSVWSSLLWL